MLARSGAASAPWAHPASPLHSRRISLPASAQQILDHLFGLRVVALAEMVVPDLPLGIDEVVCRPVAVLEGAPDLEVIVDRDGIADLEVFELPA